MKKRTTRLGQSAIKRKIFCSKSFFVHFGELLQKLKIFVQKNVVKCRIFVRKSVSLWRMFVQKNVDMERNVIKQLLGWKQKRNPFAISQRE